MSKLIKAAPLRHLATGSHLNRTGYRHDREAIRVADFLAA